MMSRFRDFKIWQPYLLLLIRGTKRQRTNFHHHYLNNKFIYLYNKNSVFLYIMSNEHLI
jgi:hypothetical protein